VPLKARKASEPAPLKARKVLAYGPPFSEIVVRDFKKSEASSIAVNFKLDNNIDLEICVDAPPADSPTK
jgi:hypothetical protein